MTPGEIFIKEAYNTCSSQAVTHPSTKQAQHCLTSVIGREPVYSVWYGHRHKSLPLIFVISFGLPQLVLLLSVTYRQLKGMRSVQYIAGKVGTLLKKIRPRNQAGDDLSDANSLPHRLVSTTGLCCQCPGKHMPTLKHL